MEENIYSKLLGITKFEFSEPNFYELLGIDETTPLEKIDIAFKNQIQKLQSLGNNPKYKDSILYLKGKLRTAQQTLSNSANRTEYDLSLIERRYEVWEKELQLLYIKEYLTNTEIEYLKNRAEYLHIPLIRIEKILSHMNVNNGKKLIVPQKQKKIFYFSKFFFRFLEILFIIIGIIIILPKENSALSYKLRKWEEEGGFLLKQSFSLPEKKFVAQIPSLVEKLSRMVYIPASNFTMGSTEQEDTSPVRTVYVDSFYISRYEVTNKEYAKFIQATGYSVPYQTGEESESFTWNPLKRTYPDGWDDMPVVLVNWNDAMEYCYWLSKEWNCTISLPTEAQWEKAARGVQELRFPWGQNLPKNGWCNIAFNSSSLASVGSFTKDISPWGCFDMAGNVSEWCRDSYKREAYKNSLPRNPYIVEDSIWGVVRGGNWTVPASSLITTTYRQVVPKTSKNIRFGFRYVLESF